MIKFIALIAMVIDHVGYLFFPDQEWMRAIGRLSMPLFGYAIARGFFYTSNSNLYIRRMAFLALFSQIPYTIMAGFSPVAIGESEFFVPILSMIVPWTMALLLLKIRPLFVAPIVVAALFIPMDYTSLIALLPFALFHLWFKSKNRMLAIFSSLFVLSLVSFLLGDPLQWWSLLAVPLMFLLEPYDYKVKINRWVFYWFYPVHMLVLCFISFLMGNELPYEGTIGLFLDQF